MKRQYSPSSSPRGSKASRTTLDPVAQDKNRNSLLSACPETDGVWADQVEQETPPEGLREATPLPSSPTLNISSERDEREEVTEADVDIEVEKEEKEEKEEEVIEELRRRLAHKATGPPPVYRVRALGAFEARAEDELSFQPGSIITVHRLSEMNPGWIVGFLDGKKGYMPANTMACLGNSGGLKRDLLEVIRTEV